MLKRRSILKSLSIMVCIAMILIVSNVFAAAPTLTKTADVQMTYSGLTVVSYGGYLNGESFQQEGILTYNGYQYTCFYNTNRHIILARRQLPSGAWNKIEISDYVQSVDDAHNTISLGIAPTDGTLHIAFDHHGSDLKYIRSVSGLVTNPTGVAWAKASFNPVTHYMGTTYVTQVTYPRYVTEPNGKMLMSYRYGTSGSGDEYLWEYSGNGAWTFIGKYIDGIANSNNAYLHGLEYNGNRLHASWCVRETPDATTNHDLFYIYSDDNGRTWKNNSGSTIATTGSSPLSTNNTGARVWTIKQNRGLINQEHMTGDNAGRVHVLLGHMPDSQADDSNFTNARTKSTYWHYWRNTNGTWSRNSIANLPVILNFRGKLAVSSTNNLYAILPDLRIASASAASNWTDWTIQHTDSGRFFSDPLIDRSRLKLENKLTIYYPQKNSPNIYTLDFNLN